MFKSTYPFLSGKLVFILIILILIFSGCSKRTEINTQLLNKLHEPTRQILQDLSFKLYPHSDLISDSFDIRPAKSNLIDGIRKPSYVINANVWLTANDDIEKIRKFYSTTVPNTISQQSQEGRTTLIQLASVSDISSAIIRNVSPIIMVEIHHKKISGEEKAIYQNELDGLKKRDKKDILSQKRIYQLERILAEKPLIRISVRKISAEI